MKSHRMARCNNRFGRGECLVWHGPDYDIFCDNRTRCVRLPFVGPPATLSITKHKMRDMSERFHRGERPQEEKLFQSNETFGGQVIEVWGM